MNRRSFFTSLSSAVAGIYVACHVNLGRLTETVSEAVKPVAFGINPAWVDAPYEVAFFFNGPAPHGISDKPDVELFKRSDYTSDRGGPEGRVLTLNPVRMDEQKNIVNPFIEL